jgi:hypothetical protein
VAVINPPKHAFRFPRFCVISDMPRYGCMTMVSAKWISVQLHLPRFLPCGCAVCQLCGQLLMYDVRGRRGRVELRHGWYTHKQDWMERFPAAGL